MSNPSVPADAAKVPVAIAAGEPTEPLSGRRVIDIVRAAYDGGTAAAVEMAPGGLDEPRVMAIVTWCADRACDQAGAWCRGCRLASDRQGITSLDSYCRQFREITFADSPIVLRGNGTSDARFESLDALQKLWQGEEVFYLARRVIRRRIKANDPRVKRMAPATAEPGLEPTVVLVAPQMAENIGMVGRAMANFGLEDLRLVAPRDGWPNEKARAAAAGANFVIDAATAYSTVAEAIADLNWICATTARQRQMTKPIMTPEQAAGELSRRLAEGQKVGMLFGAERQGLENDDVALADAVVMIPVNPRFASLNLAQAVLLLGYEWLKASDQGTLGRVTPKEEPLTTGLRTSSPPAPKEQVIHFFEHLERELDAAGFLKPADRRPHMVRNIRSIFQRLQPTEQDVRTLRGIVAALTAAHLRRRDGG